MMDGIVALGYAQQLFDNLSSGLDHAEDLGNNTIRFYWTNGTTTDVVLTGSGSITEEINANVSCGGITAGTTITAGTDLTTLAKMLLIKHIPPVVTITKPSKTLYKVGDSVTINTLAVNVTKKSKDIESVMYYKNGVMLGAYYDVGSGGTINLDIYQTITETTTFDVIANDGTSSVRDTLTYKFVNSIFLGYENAGVTEIPQEKGTIVLNATCTLDKPQIKYPKSWGVPTKFTDMNGFSMMNSFVVTEETIDNVDYYVYTNDGITTITDFKYTMEF